LLIYINIFEAYYSKEQTGHPELDTGMKGWPPVFLLAMCVISDLSSRYLVLSLCAE
jgi:hypothetical protein